MIIEIHLVSSKNYSEVEEYLNKKIEEIGIEKLNEQLEQSIKIFYMSGNKDNSTMQELSSWHTIFNQDYLFALSASLHAKTRILPNRGKVLLKRGTEWPNLKKHRDLMWLQKVQIKIIQDLQKLSLMHLQHEETEGKETKIKFGLVKPPFGWKI